MGNNQYRPYPTLKCPYDGCKFMYSVKNISEHINKNHHLIAQKLHKKFNICRTCQKQNHTEIIEILKDGSKHNWRIKCNECNSEYII